MKYINNDMYKFFTLNNHIVIYPLFDIYIHVCVYLRTINCEIHQNFSCEYYSTVLYTIRLRSGLNYE